MSSMHGSYRTGDDFQQSIACKWFIVNAPSFFVFPFDVTMCSFSCRVGMSQSRQLLLAQLQLLQHPSLHSTSRGLQVEAVPHSPSMHVIRPSKAQPPAELLSPNLLRCIEQVWGLMVSHIIASCNCTLSLRWRWSQSKPSWSEAA